MLLITGCPRSGTHWASQVLQSLGYDLGHEKLGKHGIVSWCLAPEKVEQAHLPKWHGDVTGFEPKAVVHLVREPLSCIASLTTVGKPGRRFAARYTGIAPGLPSIVWAIRFWCIWNQLAERRALFTQQVEQIRSRLPRSNTRTHDAVTWAEIGEADPMGARLVRRLAEGYGYD